MLIIFISMWRLLAYVMLTPYVLATFTYRH